MNSLPNELLLSIAGHLKIKDLIQFRMVCKRFMVLCDEVKVTELIISTQIKDSKDYWFYSNKQFNHKDAINMATFAAYRSTFKFDKYLKRLHFSGGVHDYDLLKLNDLIGLEQLTIQILDFPGDSKNFHIKLPHLKILEIDQMDICDFILTAPELEMLKCPKFSPIPLHNPETIKHLEVCACDETIEILKNLQYLRVGFYLLPQPNIAALPNLNTLDISNFSKKHGVNMESLHQLVEQKCRRPGFKVYFQSVDMVDVDKIREYELAESNLAFQMQNYHSLCSNINQVNPLDYNHLMKLVDGTLPDDFYKKYFNITKVRVEGMVKDQSHLVEFLQNLPYLKSLTLENVDFDQKFYEDISQTCSLTTLEMDGQHSAINYNFLLNFKLLEAICIDQNFHDLPIPTLWRNLTHLKYVRYSFDRESIYIEKGENGYSFRNFKNHNRLFKRKGMCLDDLSGQLDSYIRAINE